MTLMASILFTSLRFERSVAALALSLPLGACATTHSDAADAGSAATAGTTNATAGRAGDAAESGRGGPGSGNGGAAGNAAVSGKGGAGSGGVSGANSSSGRGDAPIKTKFVVRNDGEDALMLGSKCGAIWPLLYAGDNQLGLVNTCSCPCSDRDACGCPGVCLDTQELVVPGKSVEKNWDGTALDYSTDMTRSCFVERVPATGSALEVRACWNYGDRGMSDTCSSESFAYGTETEVTISAKPEAAAKSVKPTTVGIRNAGSTPIYVIKDRCGAQDWFRLNMGPEISVNTFCACDCDENFHAMNCPACGQCAADQYERIAPGATLQLEWDSKFWYRYESGCSNRYNMPLESQLKVKLCWSQTAGGDDICQETIVDVGASNILTVG